MTLFEQVNADIKTAMKAKEKEKLEALRAIKAAFLIANTEKGSDGVLADDKALVIIQKLIKQRRESADIYSKNNRQELADKELLEADVIEKYLPVQMSEAEIKAEVEKIITETGASSIKEMGRVMGMASKKLSGKADGKKIAEIVKALLT